MSNEQRIRELAHQIWESEGRPDGQDARHWEMACKLTEGQPQGDLPPSPAPKPAPRKPRKPRSKAAAPPANDQTPVEKPALLDKPAGVRKPARTKRQPIARTTKISEAGIADTDAPRE